MYVCLSFRHENSKFWRQIWAILVQICPNLPKFAQNVENLAPQSPNFAPMMKMCQNAKNNVFAHFWSKFARFWSKFAHFWSKFAHFWSEFAHFCRKNGNKLAKNGIKCLCKEASPFLSLL